jgi:quercetin dioxygenase-like cupin family protein
MAMDKERMQELAALNAVGALDGEDDTEYRRLVADCAFLRHEVTAYSQVLAGLVQSLPATVKPPPELKARIFQKIGQPQEPDRWFEALSRVLPPHVGGFAFLPQAETGGWYKLAVPGAAFKLLSLDRERGYAVALGKLDPGAHYPSHHHFGGEDLYMLTGDLKIGDQVLHAGDYHHAAAETTHPINSSEDGCTLLIVLSTETLVAQLTAK